MVTSLLRGQRRYYLLNTVLGFVFVVILSLPLAGTCCSVVGHSLEIRKHLVPGLTTRPNLPFLQIVGGQMLRWWENEEDLKMTGRDNEEDVRGVREQQYYSQSLAAEEPLRQWRFQVSAETAVGEVVCVTGSSFMLGQWASERVFPLQLNNDNNVWSGVAKIPLLKDVEFRYCVCIIVEADPGKQTPQQIVVRRWETNLYPRKILGSDQSNMEKVSEPDTFGFYQHFERVERGWLTSETAIQFKFFNNTIELWRSKLRNRPVYVKLTPVHLTKSTSTQDVNPAMLEETLSLETMELTDKQKAWPVVEISVMNEAEREFRPQEQFGRVFNENDFMMFQVLMHNPETVAYLIDFYSYNNKASEEEPPVHIGFSYILPSFFKGSEGQLVATISGPRNIPVGQLTVEYLIVKPNLRVKCDMQTSMQRHWKDTWRGLDVGHRGAGSSFKAEVKQCADVRENTIASLKAAASHGADFVEFDVQLSKDLVPVLYHDFYVCISMRKKNNGQGDDSEMLQIPMKDLTLDQLHLLKLSKSSVVRTPPFNDIVDDRRTTIYHVQEGRTKHSRFFDEDLEDHQPFPTLQQALEVLDPTVGFNVEIKWTMQLKDGSYELYHPFDLNLYLDIVLEVVLKYAGNRNIVFSCFHPDICSMIRLKQNKYPVMFLTQGVTSKWPPYHDQRCQGVPMAVHFAVSSGILGINVHSEDLLRDSSQVALVKQAGLVLFCWGDDNNDCKVIKHLKELGLHAIIYDKIDRIGAKEGKESNFRIEARESQSLMIRAVAEKAGKTKSGSELQQDGLIEVEEPHFLNMDKAKLVASPGSTSSCISIWAQPNGLSNTSQSSISDSTNLPSSKS